LDVDVQDQVLPPVCCVVEVLPRRPVEVTVYHRPFEELPGVDHPPEFFLRVEEVVDAVPFARTRIPRGGRDRELHVVAPLPQQPRDGGLTGPRRRGEDDRKEAPVRLPRWRIHSTFSTCSRRRSTSSLIATTRCAIPALFAFDPMVFASRCISCTRKDSRFPTPSAASPAIRSRASAMWERKRTSSSLMSHRSARMAISCASRSGSTATPPASSC